MTQPAMTRRAEPTFDWRVQRATERIVPSQL